MKTTLVIDDGVMKRVRQEAARQGLTISALVDASLRMMLRQQARKPKRPRLPTFDMGKPLVDISDREALCRAMEED